MTVATSESDSGGPKSRRLALVVAGVTLLLPVVLALTVWPTPMLDLRQQIAWGREFPLATPRHPPMMAWLSGIVDHLFGPLLIPQLIVGQILVVIAAIYVYRTLRLMTEEDNAFLFFFLYITAFFVFLGPSSWVMNADFLQITSWPAIVCHFLSAMRSNRWRHWLALGAWSAAAVLTKYTAGLLFISMLVAALFVPQMRTLFRRPGFYAAILLGAVLVAPHAIALLRNTGAIAFLFERFDNERTLGFIADQYWQLVWGYIQIAFPAWLIVAAGWWLGIFVFRRPKDVPQRAPEALRFVIVTNLVMLALIVVMIAFADLLFRYRFNPPFVTMAWLALGPLFAWAPGRKETAEPLLVKGIGVLNVATVAIVCLLYTFFAAHDFMQEPIRQPVETVLSDWQSNFACGPAYVFGDEPTSQLIGINAGPGVTAIPNVDLRAAPWFDPDRLRRLGAVVAARWPISDEEMQKLLPGVTLTEERAFTAPLRWTLTGQVMTYHYRFIPPQGC